MGCALGGADGASAMRRRPRARPGRAGRAGGGGRGAAGRAKRRTRPPVSVSDGQARGRAADTDSVSRPSSRQPARKSCRPAPSIAAMALSGVSAVTVPTAGAVRESTTPRGARRRSPVVVELRAVESRILEPRAVESGRRGAAEYLGAGCSWLEGGLGEPVVGGQALAGSWSHSRRRGPMGRVVARRTARRTPSGGTAAPLYPPWTETPCATAWASVKCVVR